MIGVEEAKRIMMENVRLCSIRSEPLPQAVGRYVVDDAIRSPVDHPLFTCSAVDGYAFHFDERQEWNVVVEIAAGGGSDEALAPGECARIFTGAMLPVGADTVVMQEFVRRDGGRMTHSDARLRQGGNVRSQGEQLRAGTIVLRKGDVLSPQAIGALAGLGITEVEVRTPPGVAVITSGTEFITGDQVLPGKIFSSNDIMLLAALRKAGIQAQASRCPDDARLLGAAIGAAAQQADVVITTGGVSVGDHDLVLPVLQELGAEIRFHHVAQKPGKPMLFAMLNGKPVFGLPGNPRAVMVLFWEYVLPYLRTMQGANDPWLRSDRLPMERSVQLKGDRAEFRAARVSEGRVTLLADEGSHMLRSLVDADAMAYFPSDVRLVSEGDPIEIHYLPG
ncbi:MAG TPA: molybdopterin molybdotransferase MoeA [Flavobacteriales bacterium]|nr:molybdopterin molybdotransferase MoeA [Flavobacteriales bacterium]